MDKDSSLEELFVGDNEAQVLIMLSDHEHRIANLEKLIKKGTWGNAYDAGSLAELNKIREIASDCEDLEDLKYRLALRK